MENIIFNAVLLLISIGGFLLGKFVFPNVPKSVADKLRQLAAWADKFVVWAREFRKQDSGTAKMEMVVEQLKAVAKEAGWNVTEDQLRAIAQAAYENMMKGAAEAQQPQEIAQAASTARYYEIGRRKFAEASTVVINVPGGSAAVSVPGVAVATDNVPEGALEPNPDGSVNAYDEAGLKVGTVDADTAEVVAAGVDVVIVEGGQAAQGAAKAAPEAAGGTDTATAAEGAQNAPQTAQDGQQEHDNT